MADEERSLTMLNQISSTFNAMPQSRRMTMTAIGLATLLGFGYIIFGDMLTGDWKPVASGLSPEDSQAAITALESKEIGYKLDDGGTILVQADDIHDARLELAVSAMPSGRSVGFELFDESELGRSAFSEKVNYHRALEGELERTISHLRPVKRARVHLVLPERSLFEEDEPIATASVMVALRPGQSLAGAQVKAIRHLVAAAVERLSASQVAVIDQGGAMLARTSDEDVGMDGSFEKQSQFELSMERRIVKLLEPVVGAGAVRAQVSAQLDLSKTIETEEKFDPDSQVARSEREQTDSSNSDSQPAAGAPGGASNIPQLQPPGNVLQKNQAAKSADRVVNYEIDRYTTRREKPTAELTRLSVAVVIDDKKVVDEETGDISFVAREDAEIEKYKKIVARAVGINLTRGDQLEVLHVPFVQAGKLEEIPEEDTAVLLGMNITQIALAAGGFLAFITLFFVWRRNKKQKAIQEERNLQAARDSDDSLYSPDGLAVGDQVELLREKVQSQSNDDIRMAASIIRKWVSDS